MKRLYILLVCAMLMLASYTTYAGPPISGGGGAGLSTDTLWDAAGDTTYGTGANTGARLPIGTAYQVYRVNAGATAPEWGTGGPITTTAHGATEAVTAATLYGNFHNITGAYTVTLAAAVVGMSATFNATTGAVFSVDCNVADHFVLAGTALTAGNKLTSSGLVGDQVEVVCTAANTWTVKHVSGVIVDGGA